MAQAAVGTGMLATLASRDNPQDYSHIVGQGHFHSLGGSEMGICAGQVKLSVLWF